MTASFASPFLHQHNQPRLAPTTHTYCITPPSYTAQDGAPAIVVVMAVSSSLAEVPLEHLTLYHAPDPYLSSILLFYGPVTTANATISSSRIQAHIFTPAGYQSYPRITISPAAPLYAAVNHLPREEQGDEVCRALAFTIFKYLTDLPDPAKTYLIEMARTTGKQPNKLRKKCFDEKHAAELASRMAPVDDASGIARDVRSAFHEHQVPWVDVDVVLPRGTIQAAQQSEAESDGVEYHTNPFYGQYSSLVRVLGEPMFLPTSTMKRPPSQPNDANKSRVFPKAEKEALRYTMCEVADSEERYVGKVYDLVRTHAANFRFEVQIRPSSRTSPDETALEALFPPASDEILELNMGFLQAVRNVIEGTEESAFASIAEEIERPVSPTAEGNDPTGAVALANTFVEWLPHFSGPYAEYMRAHEGFSQTLNHFMRDEDSWFSKRVHDMGGEQKLQSLLIEPVQRLPRYSLLIDTMMSKLPVVHPAVRPFLKARDMIKNVCALDNHSPADSRRSISRLKDLVGSWPSDISPSGRLISVVDVNEMSPPYHVSDQSFGPTSGMLMIYQNCLVVLSKSADSRASSRILLPELDRAPPSGNTSVSSSISPSELRVSQVLDIHSIRCFQSPCGRALFLARESIPKDSESGGSEMADFVALQLSGMHSGRAHKLIEEIVKAKIEDRFAETDRESGRCTLRNPTGQASGNAGMLACVFEDEQEAAANKMGSSKIRIVFDTPKEVCSELLNNSDLEVIVSVSSPGESQYRMDIDSIIGGSSSDVVTEENFIHVLLKRRKSPFNSLMA